MLSSLREKTRESAISVIPILLIVVLLDLALLRLPWEELARFLIGGVLIILGLSVFLTGAELGMVAFGEKVGGALTRRRNIILILAASFVVGFAITIAEPDVQVLASQIANLDSNVDRDLILLMIAIGVGFFLMVAMVRVIMQFSLRLLLIGFYLLLFLICAFVDPGYVGVAFDSGGATTGPITVPFIMAMGLGVAANIMRRGDNDNSFGFIGLASIGPIMAVALMGLFSGVKLGAGGRPKLTEENLGVLESFLSRFLHILENITFALLPVFILFLVFQFTLLRLPSEQMRRMLLGFFYSFAGLVVFMLGVEGGFTPVGQSLGVGLGALADGWLLIPVGLLLGAVVVCAEPAVWVLTEQVEKVSGGYLKRRYLLFALSLSISLAVALGMIRVVTGIGIWWMLIPGYLLALGLTGFSPRLFTAIAFDSGGVASGPMSTTFVLALTVGASVARGGNPVTDAFGMVAMIAMAPLVTIQVFGIIVATIEKKQNRRRRTRIMKPGAKAIERR
ncbi:MAG: DUF1538 domain-containing protein [Planctomycetota bacterium]|jgi:hypothetical protein|nr:DUF1538 domain-containing protein [Planctomycetota bacterium]